MANEQGRHDFSKGQFPANTLIQIQTFRKKKKKKKKDNHLLHKIVRTYKRIESLIGKINYSHAARNYTKSYQ